MVSEAAMRRPEEVFRPEARGAAAGEAELSREERRARRAKKKRAFKKRGQGEARARAPPPTPPPPKNPTPRDLVPIQERRRGRSISPDARTVWHGSGHCGACQLHIRATRVARRLGPHSLFVVLRGACCQGLMPPGLRDAQAALMPDAKVGISMLRGALLEVCTCALLARLPSS